jgi:hypothetical protein
MSRFDYMVAFLTQRPCEISLALQRGALVGMMVSDLKVIGKHAYSPLKDRSV